MAAKSKRTVLGRGPKKQLTKIKRGDARGAGRKGTTKIKTQSQSVPKKSTKIASLTVLLCRIKGVSIDELCKHTGWQPHSVRAVISSVIKKKLGLEVVSEKVNGVRIYRVIV